MTQYYIIHSTSIENLQVILNTKVLYANKYIDDKYMRLSGINKMPYVYTALCIPPLLDKFAGFTLLLHPNILEKESFIFNYGWLADPTDKSIYVASNDDIALKKKNINTMLNYVKATDNVTDQEILFPGRILLDEYLIGILCYKCDNATVDKLKKILKNNNYKKVKIYTGETFPDIDIA